MGILKSTAASAGLAFVLAGANAESVRQPVGFEQEVPEKAFIDAGMNVRSYHFATVPEHPSTIIKQAMYDREVGIACSWNLVKAESDFKMAVADHVCSKRDEPEGWKRAASAEAETPSAQDTVGISTQIDYYGDRRKIVQFSTSANPDSVFAHHQVRFWNEAKSEVCLASGLSIGPLSIAEVNHGCFKMDRKEFVIKRAIASFGPSHKV